MTSSPPPVYIPLDQAAEKYKLSKRSLLERVKSGQITAAQLSNGEYLIAEQDVDPSLSIRREDFDRLRGQKISRADVARKYKIGGATLVNWMRAGRITVLAKGQKALLDEADVAFGAAIYHAKAKLYDGQMTGVRIFDKEGNPFQAKHPRAAAYRRAYRHRKRRGP
jgi:hypothetical protein